MTVYVILLISAYLCSYCRDKSVFHIFIFLFMFLILAFRDISVGTDTMAYLDMVSGWNYEIDFSLDSVGREMEVLWSIFVKYIGWGRYSARWVIIVPAFLNTFLVYWAYRRFKVGIGLAIFFYILLTFYFLSFNITRQCLAMSVVLFGSSFLVYGKKWVFFSCVILASFIHFSAIFSISFYFVYKIDVKEKIMYICLVLSLVIGIVGVNLSFLEMNAYALYADNLGMVEESSMNRMLLRIFMTFLTIYFVYKKKIKDSFLLKMFFISICVSNISISLHHFVSRVSFYLTMFQPVFYSSFFRKETMSGGLSVDKDIIFYLLVLSLLVFWIHYLNINSGEIVPYKLSEHFL